MKNDDIILSYFKNKWKKFYRSNWQNKLNWQTKFRLSEIVGIENYFYQEINQRKSCSKKLNKYVTAFDYIDKVLIVLSATSSRISIILFTSIAGAPIGLASAGFTLFFSPTTGIVTEYYKKQKEKAW